MAQISQAWAHIRDTRDGEWYLSQARANYRRKSELLQQIAVLEEALASDSVKVHPAVLATELGFGTASSAVSRDAFSHITACMACHSWYRQHAIVCVAEACRQLIC